VLTLNCAGTTDLKRIARFLAAVTIFGITSLGACPPAYSDEVAVGGCIRGVAGEHEWQSDIDYDGPNPRQWHDYDVDRRDATLNCVARWGKPGDPYVRTVPAVVDSVEQSRDAERERQWEQRCKPVVAPDRYGVPRYHYSALSCEFGILN
jgi:hypothetical protein